MHKNQKNHLLSQIKPCILNQSENVPIRQCTVPARNIFAKQPLENAGTWQGERGCVQTYFAQERPRTNQKNIPPIPANPFTIGINGFIVFMIMPIYTQIRHLRKDGLHD